MKEKKSRTSSTAASIDRKGDASKLVSLLALATGAVAMPQTSNADIIFTDLSGNPGDVGDNSGASFLISNLPGIARFGFQFTQVATNTVTTGSSRWIVAGQAAGYVRVATTGGAGGFFLVKANDKSVTWNQISPLHMYRTGTMGFANDQFQHGPNSYDHKYIAFRFQDSTAGNALRYGWIDVSLSNPGNATGPDVTIFGYAYETSGATIPMGAMPVPEPSTMSLLALGALALGSRGVRSWRNKRVAAK